MTISKLIDQYYENRPNRPRPHLGASLIGHHCRRWLWLSFRFAVFEKFEGRILRLFQRGQNEEPTVIDNLSKIGCKISCEQERVDFGWHVSGSMDGVIESGVPEDPDKRHVLEIKTHSKKSFDDLLKNGVEKSKPMHYTQMQMYMLGSGIDRALYYAVCKDDDRIYTERLSLDKPFAESQVQKAHEIVQGDLPEPISADPTWYQCKFCPGRGVCHEGDPIERNCRTCVHSMPEESGEWYCGYHMSVIPSLDWQLKGCDNYAPAISATGD